MSDLSFEDLKALQEADLLLPIEIRIPSPHEWQVFVKLKNGYQYETRWAVMRDGTTQHAEDPEHLWCQQMALLKTIEDRIAERGWTWQKHTGLVRINHTLKGQRRRTVHPIEGPSFLPALVRAYTKAAALHRNPA